MKKNLKEAVVQAALAFIQKKGLQTLSLRELARQLKVSHMAPYRHFKTREDLLAEIARRGFGELGRRLDEGRMKGNSFQEKFRFMGHAYVRFVIENPATARVMFAGLEDIRQYPECDLEGMNCLQRLVDFVQDGLAQGSLRGGDPLRISLVLWSALHGLAMLQLENLLENPCTTGDNPVSLDVLTDLLLDALIKGLT